MKCPKCHYTIPAALITSERQSLIASRPRPGRIGLAPVNRKMVTCTTCGAELTSTIMRQRPKCPHQGKDGTPK